MDEVPDASVALVVTSPPYFAGKEYEEALGHGEFPATYLQYLDMLGAVFAECVKKLEPGGRIAVNVANLGRRPYRSLSSDVVEHPRTRPQVAAARRSDLAEGARLGRFVRVGIVPEGDEPRAARPHRAGGDREQGSLRPRAVDAAQRKEEQPPVRSRRSLASSSWTAPPTCGRWHPRARRRVNHPAPFPVELPLRLIDLYTYKGDLVLDPFMGSGTTAVAAVRAGRHFVGYDTDPEYVRERTRASRRNATRATSPLVERSAAQRAARRSRRRTTPRTCSSRTRFGAGGQGREGSREEPAEAAAGSRGIEEDRSCRAAWSSTSVPSTAHDGVWYFDVSGAFSSTRPGLKRTDTLWKALGKALVLSSVQPNVPLVLITTDLPRSCECGRCGVATGHGGRWRRSPTSSRCRTRRRCSAAAVRPRRARGARGAVEADLVPGLRNAAGPAVRRAVRRAAREPRLRARWCRCR